MQSSAMVALRTVIMITCLVAVPLAAVFGTALPKVVQSAFDRGKTSPWSRPATTEDEPAPPVLAVEDLNPTAPAQPGPESSVADNSLRLPIAHITGVRPIDEGLLTPPSAATVQTAPLWNPPPPRTAQAPKTRDMTAHFAPSPVPHRMDEAHARHEPRAGGLQKTVYSQPHGEAAEDSAEDHDRLVAVERADSGRADNVLADGERRLRRLGATYYRLETWGGDGQLYRCSCNIAVSAGSRVTRHFEAIEAAPSQAIEAVIKQVDAWRARRRAG
jgi:hypothetical protein